MMLHQTTETSDGTQVDSTPLDLKDILDPAHYVDSFLFICTTILTIIGILINTLTIGSVVFIKRLHLPRVVNWIGIGVSNIFVLVSRLMFAIAAHYWETSTISSRGFYTWFVLTSSLSLTSNVISTVIERYICITYPKWHKRYISMTFIIAYEFSMSVIVFLIPMIIVNLESFQSYLSNFKLFGTLFAIVFPLFLTGFVSFLAMFKKPIRQVTHPKNPPLGMKNSRISIISKPHLSAGNQLDIGVNSETGSAGDEKENKKNIKRSTEHFIRVGNNRISQLEVGAKHTFHYLALIYLVFMVPSLISFISVLICLQVSPSSYYSFMGAFYHICIIASCLHSGIVDPVAFVFLSKDLLLCFKSRTCRNCSSISKQKPRKEDENNASPYHLETIFEEPYEETGV